ncbi:ATP-dependent DNA helicase RecG [Helicobacter didelphidarum]|uniref:ATP-dependent DNA helicase RecG n=1 Tax=Helicobacter didelphidarum TaxID=2040648 RepID=A0A3D8IMY9_9HELI|nr:DEAD/DEAH box helicase [Helicobacter didelphidarum]RDU66370.1 ATP-dependent DNA helicase RecG [Helicobacter didelphidarum]
MDSILLYCLENLPKSYESTYLLQQLSHGERGGIEVTISSIRHHNNILFIESYSKAFNTSLQIIVFNARPYHKQVFVPHKTLCVLGTIEIRLNSTSNAWIPVLINPKVISKKNTIIANFKQRGIRLENLQKVITLQSLQDSQIPEIYAHALYEVFYPTQDFFHEYMQTKSFPKRHLNAIKFCEILVYMQKLRKKRKHFNAKFCCNGDISPLLSNLPFQLTQGQYRAIQSIAADLDSNTACKRIIMGDVGCGKTIVILASVMIAYPYKSILMVPTTILAKQLYTEAKKYLPSNIQVSCIISSTSKKDISHLQSDFIIGTQALLYRDSDFSKFALVMTDEQHRFGTNTRTKLERLLEENTENDRKKPHNLQFSATPIPRTMSMIQSNLINFSFIKELPFRKDIQTLIINKSQFGALFVRIQTELQKSNQVAIIYPRIEEISEDFDRIDSPDDYQSMMGLGYNQYKKSHKIPYMSLKEAQKYWQNRFEKVFITHGKDRDKETILEEFAKTDGAILLATTMVEVGISLPRLSVIVIVGAERLGLASLHQLRGRVSRNGLKGYCYLYTHNKDNQRLQEFSHTLSGFDIAELDLKYRSSGDLLDGKFQSGNNFNFFNMLEDSSIAQEAQDFLDHHK